MLPLILGLAGFGYHEARREAEQAAVAATRAEVLDHEISDRIYQWLALAQTLATEEPAFSSSSGFAVLYGQLIRRPGVDNPQAPGVRAVRAEFQDRGLLSLVLELADCVDAQSSVKLQAIASLLVRPDPILNDCRSPRECASVLAMNILLDRWRR